MNKKRLSFLLIILLAVSLAVSVFAITIPKIPSVKAQNNNDPSLTLRPASNGTYQQFTVFPTGITRVQGNARGKWSTGTSFTVTLASTPTSGDILILVFGSMSSGSSSITVSSITETGVTWTGSGTGKQVGLASKPNYADDGEIWLGLVGSSASTTITINLSGTPAYAAIADVCEYSGIVSSSFLDVTATSQYNYFSSPTAVTTGTTGATVSGSELWIGVVVDDSWPSAQSTPQNGFTLLDGASTNPNALSVAYLENIISSTNNAQAYSGTTCSSGGIIGCIATFKASVFPYVQSDASAVDSVTDIGTHSNFAYQQQAPNTGQVDTLTEANTAGNGGTETMGTTTNTGTSYTTIAANGFAGAKYVAPSFAIDIASVTFYGAFSSGTHNVKVIITDSSGNILTNGISGAVSCTNSAGSHTATYTTKPTISAGSTYGLIFISDTSSFRLYYVGTTGAPVASETGSNTYSSPTTPLSFTPGTVNYRACYATCDESAANYELMLEEQFTSIPAGTWQLGISTYTWTTSDALEVDAWGGSSWTQIISSLSQNTWNNVTGISSYILSGTMTIRFMQETQTDSTTQNYWTVDSCQMSLVASGFTAAISYSFTFGRSVGTSAAYFSAPTKAFTFGKSDAVHANYFSTPTYSFSFGKSIGAVCGFS